MATQTPNIGLTKQAQNEYNHNPVLNSNWDIVDSKMGQVPSGKSVQGEIDEANQQIGDLSNLTTTDKSSLVGAANELNGKFGSLFLEIKCGIVNANSTKNIDYPTGYTNTNSFVVSYCITNTAGDQKYYDPNVLVALIPNNILLTNNTSNNVSMTVVLIKI